MIKIISMICLLMSLLFGTTSNAVQYNDLEINQRLNQKKLMQLSTEYIQDYYSSKQPKIVIDALLASNMSPLEREYILFNLLTVISQQPPQSFHQEFVNQMKTYAVEATRADDEGHLPVSIFKLNSKAHGIEHIWTVYRTEQQFNQLFNKDMHQAVSNIKPILAQENAQARPQWLGIKNSIAALAKKNANQLINYLTENTQVNTGLDVLISHVGLHTGHVGLIKKALFSIQPKVRESTLRQLPMYLPQSTAKSLLMDHVQSGSDDKFSISLLSQFSHDKLVENFLINQLNSKATAATAAFALSQSNNPNLPSLLKKQFQLSQNETEKNHLILALKLSKSDTAKRTLDDLLELIDKGSKADQWLKSFEHKNSGEQP